jgi:soluble lytic murein transglycosylase-like protein
MGQVDNIYISKLGEIQARLNSVTSGVGFPSIRFADVLNAAETQAQTVPSYNTYSPASVSSYANTVSADSPDEKAYDAIIAQAAQKYGLDPNLIKAVARVESNFHAKAVSGAGAMGLMQLMPGTARELKVSDPYDPVQNINGGAAYIKKQLDRFGDIRLALAAYNTGPGRVASLHIADADNPEEYQKLSKGVRGYVDKVLSYYQEYAAGD